MTDPTIALKEFLINIGLEADADLLREGVQLFSQMLMEVEVEQQIEAAKHDRTPECNNQCNGFQERTWETWVGEVELGRLLVFNNTIDKLGQLSSCYGQQAVINTDALVDLLNFVIPNPSV